MNSPFVAAGFKGRASRLSPRDVQVAATLLGVDLVALQAVIAVETAGQGFDYAGRPTILFEPHIFYRHLAGDQLDQAIAAGLAYPNWGEKPYPRTSDGNYQRLTAACAINEAAALQSASWGLGQIMGWNFQPAGFQSVQAMVVAFIDSEAAQLGGLAAFVRASGLVPDLRAGNWRGFAYGFNGPGYAQNHYDEKLSAYVTAHTSAKPVTAVAAASVALTADDLNAAELARLPGDTSPSSI